MAAIRLFLHLVPAGFHICRVQEVSRGDNVQTLKPNPVFTDYKMKGHPTIVSLD